MNINKYWSYRLMSNIRSILSARNINKFVHFISYLDCLSKSRSRYHVWYQLYRRAIHPQLWTLNFCHFLCINHSSVKYWSKSYFVVKNTIKINFLFPSHSTFKDKCKLLIFLIFIFLTQRYRACSRLYFDRSFQFLSLNKCFNGAAEISTGTSNCERDVFEGSGKANIAI